MPAGRIDQSLYIGAQGGIELLNASTLYKPGELGGQIQINGKGYQLVQLDSGATSATPAGAPVCGSVAYWKSRPSYIVTNDIRFAEGYTTGTTGQGANSVAGVFCQTATGANVAGTATLTPGYYGVIQQRGTHVGIYTNATTASGPDQWLVSDTANTGKAAAVALATAPAYTPIGRATAATGAVTASYTPAKLGGFDLVDVP
jgi:hypothetical protein